VPQVRYEILETCWAFQINRSKKKINKKEEEEEKINENKLMFEGEI